MTIINHLAIGDELKLVLQSYTMGDLHESINIRFSIAIKLDLDHDRFLWDLMRTIGDELEHPTH